MEKSLRPLHDEQAERFEVLVDELLPPLRVVNWRLTEEEVFELAVRVAAYSLAGESFVWGES